MARSVTSSSTAVASRKRKSTGNVEGTKGRSTKQSKNSLDAYFSPQVLASSAPGEDEGSKQHVSLNEQQISVLKMVVEEEKNVFFTGAAGTGKSLLLRAIITALRKKHAKKPECVSVTASTGMAASNIGGTTIHAWGAVTPGMHDIGKLISCIKTARPAHQRWKTTKVLIIDEACCNRRFLPAPSCH
ncbi:PIF1-like helicase-domain-containing protein [Irpex rosettiformis]|uniref:PIF1-like helicase-domain-containing protein n=1 Tax=Irpex rosettiformis TaxID=378272 RepID=A0ACB8U3W2_9APHY|nr:PIF1-like helicase-domain-containing protein [Irpex rosettiformis]